MGDVIGITDYKNNPASRPISVKIESGGPDDYYIGFNRGKTVWVVQELIYYIMVCMQLNCDLLFLFSCRY